MQLDQIRQKSLITAIKTPFSKDGKIDLTAYDYLVEKQIQAGVDGIIVGGTTGEGHLLDWEEHLMLIAHSASRYGDKLLIVGNTGSNNTREAVKATEYGFASGMHASLQINPYYGKTTQEGVFQHISRTLSIGPAIVYNVAGRTGQDIETEIMFRLADHENFIGVKECSGNARIAEYESRGVACWSGNDDECFAGRHQMKSHGVISVTSNLVPSLMREMMDNPESTNYQALLPIMQWLFKKPNPIGINTALAMTGAIQPIFRLPYLPLSAEDRAEGFRLMEEIGIEQLVGKQLSLMEDDNFTVVV